MKIMLSQLRRIIREEVKRTLKLVEGPRGYAQRVKDDRPITPPRNPDGTLVDDEHGYDEAMEDELYIQKFESDVRLAAKEITSPAYNSRTADFDMGSNKYNGMDPEEAAEEALQNPDPERIAAVVQAVKDINAKNKKRR